MDYPKVHLLIKRISYIWFNISQIAVILSALVLFLMTTRCQKDSTITPAIIKADVTFLGHKGGGNNTYNPNQIENTLLSFKEGLKTLDGVETDLQMSLDGTIWLFHNTDLGDWSCASNYHHTIVLMKDADIVKVNMCNGNIHDRVYKLEELISFWSSTPNGFPISMHIKLDFEADTINNPLIGGEAAYLSKFAERLKLLFPTIKYPNQINIEVYDATFCTKIHTILPGLKVCLIKEVTFPKQINDALALGYDGVSCSISESTLTLDEVKRAHSNGLIVHIWTCDSNTELLKAYNLKPDFIQTDNLNAINIVLNP